MPYPHKEPRRLVEKIKAAFADTPQPVGQIILGTCWCDECSSAQEWLSEKHWRQFLRKDKRNFDDLGWDLCALNSEAWHFFLPALLVQSIKNDGRETHHLEPTTSSKLVEYKAERFQTLTKRQCQVIQSYIRYVSERSEAKSLETEVTAKYPERFAATRLRHQEKYAALLEFWREQELIAKA